MADRKDIIATAIFDWLTGPEVVEGAEAQPPYTHNIREGKLYLGVDGFLDCNLLAEAIDAAIVKADG